MNRIPQTIAALMVGVAAGSMVLSTPAQADRPETYRPECCAPAPDTTVIQYDERQGPYRIASVNGFAGNERRIQAIRSAEAWATRPENAANIEPFDVVSAGDDGAAQIDAGGPTGKIVLPAAPSNLCFGGPAATDMLIPSSDKACRVRTHRCDAVGVARKEAM